MEKRLLYGNQKRKKGFCTTHIQTLYDIRDVYGYKYFENARLPTYVCTMALHTGLHVFEEYKIEFNYSRIGICTFLIHRHEFTRCKRNIYYGHVKKISENKNFRRKKHLKFIIKKITDIENRFFFFLNNIQRV